jgi:DNA-binding transcriptional LysR family regulator
MDEKDWTMLITIAEERNITRAAERLYISQPAITYRLRMLENRFHTKLVFRTPSGVLLTPEGEFLLKYAKDMQLQLLQTKEKLMSLGGKVQGPLRIGSSAIFANYELPQILKGFLELHPAVEVFLKTGRSRQVSRMLEKEEVSLAIVRGDYPWDEEKHLLREEPICLVSRHPLKLEELPDKPRIIYGTDSSLQEMVDEWWRQTFFRPPFTHMAVDTMDTCRRMVVHNLGWAVLPSIGLNEHDGLFTLPLHWKNGEPLLRRTWGLCRRMSLELPAVRTFLQYLTEARQTPT